MSERIQPTPEDLDIIGRNMIRVMRWKTEAGHTKASGGGRFQITQASMARDIEIWKKFTNDYMEFPPK